MSDLRARVAGAPITWGICEVPGWGHQLGADRVLSEMSSIGITATELGPDGFLPAPPAELRSVLDRHGLRAVGGFVPAVLHQPDRLHTELARVSAAADRLAAAGASVLVLAADSGRSGYESATELDHMQWRALVRAIDRVVEIGDHRHLEVAFHPHVGTPVEGPSQIERLLETSSVRLCLDTGHVFVGGADPAELARTAGDRVAHAHLKDASGELAHQVRRRRLGYREAVARGLYRRLGAGDAGVGMVIRTLEGAGYQGWYVLEQDTVLERDPAPGSGPAGEAASSLAFIGRVADELEQPARADARRG